MHALVVLMAASPILAKYLNEWAKIEVGSALTKSVILIQVTHNKHEQMEPVSRQ